MLKAPDAKLGLLTLLRVSHAITDAGLLARVARARWWLRVMNWGRRSRSAP